MPVGGRTRELLARVSGRHAVSVGIGVSLAAFSCALVCGTGCMTRSEDPVWGPDSTLVYPTKLANDISASITFQLRDSDLREALRKADRDRRREMSRLRRQSADILALEEERQRRANVEAKRKADAQKKAKGKKKRQDNTSSAEAVQTAPRPDPAVRDTLEAIEARLAVLAAEDSISALVPWKLKREDGSSVEERSFEIEEGARVQAVVRLENIYARGNRPLMFHLVWLNPQDKRVFKRMVEYIPNDSTQTLTSSLTIAPTKRSAGRYSLQVFLFREQIAQKSFKLTGVGVEEQVKEGGDAM